MINKKMKIFLKERIQNKFKEIYRSENFNQMLKINEKSDKSIVTEIDLYISNLVKDEMKGDPLLKELNFYSEEDLECFKLPCLVLDPIDGTAALAKGTPECVVSLAILSRDLSKSFGWLYNPFTGFEISTDDLFVNAPSFPKQKTLIGMVSRSDYKRGVFEGSSSEIVYVYPKGSIAFKLGLLASGACDFIISLTPKNIWDIAAGTVILLGRGFNLYQKGRKVTCLDEVKLDGDLVWCRPGHLEEIRSVLIKN